MTRKECQGYLGNLKDKTREDLVDLLQRQEKLISKRKFLETLPDKGRKIMEFAERLTQLISNRDELDSTACMFSELRLSVVPEKISTKNVTELKNTPANDSDKANSKRESSEMIDDTNTKLVSNIDKDRQLDSVTTSIYVNSYQKVIQRSSGYSIPPAFKPNSTLNIRDVEALPKKYLYKSNIQSCDLVKEDPSNSSASHKQTPMSIAGRSTESVIPCTVYRYKKAESISIEESIRLQQEQKDKQDKLVAIQAALRLADRLHITMDTYNPEGKDMAYRDTEPAADSDDDLDGEDYPED